MWERDSGKDFRASSEAQIRLKMVPLQVDSVVRCQIFLKPSAGRQILEKVDTRTAPWFSSSQKPHGKDQREGVEGVGERSSRQNLAAFSLLLHPAGLFRAHLLQGTSTASVHPALPAEVLSLAFNLTPGQLSLHSPDGDSRTRFRVQVTLICGSQGT